MAEPFAFAAFRSRQSVMEYESKLNQAGIVARTINTPHEIAMGCGLSVMFPTEDYERARAIYESYRPQAFIGFYRASYQGGKLVCEVLMRKR
ncbi:MAG: DUF3343 domain-containing protein [Eubacteriales bacterium]|nr:DUF3343 domain-containing protein [Eubacteriales bacterium]